MSTAYPDINNYAWGVDISSYNGLTFPFADLKAAGASLFICKASDGRQMINGSQYDYATYVDPTFSHNVQAAYDVNRPLVAYHFMTFNNPQSPTRDTDIQFQSLLKALEHKTKGISYHGIMLDLEEQKAINTNSNISKMVQQFISWLNTDEKTSGLPIIIYTTTYWLNQYSPDLINGIASKGSSILFIIAKWLRDPATQPMTPVINWDDIKAAYFPEPTQEYTILTPGFSNWFGWQFDCNCMIQGHQLDLNIFHMQEPELWTALNFIPRDADPVPAPTQNISITALSARLEKVEKFLASIKFIIGE